MATKTVTVEFKKGGTTYDYICLDRVRVGQYAEVYTDFTGKTIVKVVATATGVSEKARQRITRIVPAKDVKNKW